MVLVLFRRRSLPSGGWLHCRKSTAVNVQKNCSPIFIRTSFEKCWQLQIFIDLYMPCVWLFRPADRSIFLSDIFLTKNLFSIFHNKNFVWTLVFVMSKKYSVLFTFVVYFDCLPICYFNFIINKYLKCNLFDFVYWYFVSFFRKRKKNKFIVSKWTTVGGPKKFQIFKFDIKNGKAWELHEIVAGKRRVASGKQCQTLHRNQLQKARGRTVAQRW